MKRKVKIAMITFFSLLTLATTGSASAANTYNITDSSYANYFDSSGYINDTSIASGDVLDCSGNINNKDMYIDLPLSITSTSKTGKINNGTITILPDGSGTNITNLIFKNTDHNGQIAPGTIVLYNTNRCTIIGNTITTNQTGIDSYGIHLIGTDIPANNNRIIGNTITTTGDGSGTATTSVTGNVTAGNGKFTYGVYLYGSCSNNVFDSNNIHTTGKAATVDWSGSESGNLGGVYSLIGFFIDRSSNNNTLTNNNITTDCNQIHGDYDTLLGVGIHTGSSYNKLTGNTINTTGYSYAYGLEIGGNPGGISFGNVVLNNTIYSTVIREDITESYANGIKVTSYANNTLVSGNNISAVAYRFSYPVYLEDFGYGNSIQLGPSTVTENRVYGSAQVVYGFELFYAYYQNITHNNITTMGNYAMGIGTYGSCNNDITHNNITTTGNTTIPVGYNVDTIPASNEGIKIYFSSNKNIIDSNHIISGDVYAVNLDGPTDHQSTNNKVSNNYLYSGSGSKLGDGAVNPGTNNIITNNYGGPPTANFTITPTTGVAPLTVQFNYTSTGTINTYQWDFGDNTTSQLQNPTHTYTTPGNYTIKLTVTGLGGSASKTVNITVVQPDTTAPVTKANLKGGLYNTTKKVTLTATDNIDTNPKIYYTVNGTAPTSKSALYKGPLSISKTTTLKFIAIDKTGNISPVQTETYTIDTTKPNITTINPSNGATKVAANKIIKVTFSEAIKKGNNFSVELKNSKRTAIPFKTSISGKILTIDPNSNLAESLYTLTIHTGAVTDLAGNPVAAKTSKFSVGTSPTVVKSDPANGAVKVAASKTIKVIFNENIKKGNNFQIDLKNSAGKSAAFTATISGKTLSIKPKNKLAESKYKLTLHTGAVTDLAGNPVAAKSVTFTTGTPPTIKSTSPANVAKNVARNKAITLNFSENIKASSNYFVELVASNGSQIAIKKSIKNKTLTITHTKLKANTKYQLILHTRAVTDLAGNPQAAKTISFTTGKT